MEQEIINEINEEEEQKQVEVEIKSDESEEQMSLWEILSHLLSNREYVMLLLSLTVTYYVVAGVQYWTSSYMITVLGVDRQSSTAFISISSITAPISGLLVGGITTSYYGGHHTQKSQKITLIMGWCSCLVSIPVPLVR